MNTTWLTNTEYLDVEVRQAREEGKDVTPFMERIEAVKSLHQLDREVMAAKLVDEIAHFPVGTDFPYSEPSDLEGIRAERPEGPRRLEARLSDEQLYDKVYGAWLGRCAGCLLGKPVEGYAMRPNGREGIREFLKATNAYPLEDYFDFQYPDDFLTKYGFSPQQKSFDPSTLGRMPEDDDTNYTVLGLRILEQYGIDFTPEDVAEAWLSHLPLLHTCTAERVAYRNLANLIMPPMSAVHRNPYREWIGAQIRADMWGYVTPGNPELGAELAWRDACISHTKNGIYGEMFVAAMLSAAFATSDVEEIIRAGLSEIPARSRLAEAVNDILGWWKEDNADWEKALDKVYGKYGHYHPVHTINNALLVCTGLLYGGLDFGKSIGIAVMGAWDTDCNGATTGSIVGLMLGAKALPEKWVCPLQDTLETGVQGYNLVKISELANRTARFAWGIIIDDQAQI